MKYTALILAGLLLTTTPAANAQEPTPEDVVTEGLAAGEEAEESDEDAPGSWKGTLGFSYVLTTGNTETETGGIDLASQRIPDPWGVEFTASALVQEAGGVSTADRQQANIRGTRRMGSDWRSFVGISYLNDTFAGYKSRWLGALGATYLAIKGKPQSLSLDIGLSYTDEEFTTDNEDEYAGLLGGLTHRWKITPTATFLQRGQGFVSLDDSDNWRGTYNASLTATISARWALRVGFQVRFENQPVEGFETTDTKTDASLVVSF